MSDTMILAFGEDVYVKPASDSQREQGSVGFVRSATLTVNGEAVTEQRLNATTAREFAAAAVAAHEAGGPFTTATLTLVKRGRPTLGTDALSFAASLGIAPTPVAEPVKATGKAK